MGPCSVARTPPRAVRPSRWRDQEAARSNRRESLVSVRVTSQWCAQENARDAPAWSSRAGSSPPTIDTVLEKLHSALQKSRIDRATTRPTGEGWS